MKGLSIVIAGKTGTAELEPSDKDSKKFLSTFASWAPAEDLPIMVVLQLESTEPASSATEKLRPIYEALRTRARTSPYPGSLAAAFARNMATGSSSSPTGSAPA